jgi:dTDP-4-dehydrorhamnose reductase
MLRLLILGSSGILGLEVLKEALGRNFDFLSPRSEDLDVRNAAELEKAVSSYKPDWIINCAAWTNVDGAESSTLEALELNRNAVENIATTAAKAHCAVVHISTDYVFDGGSDIGYSEDDLTNPINHYGLSKWEGEVALLKERSIKSYILRTSWLYGVTGKNFVRTMTARALRGEESKVVSDQIGSPTNARDLAKGIFSIVEKGPEKGIYHFSNQGSCSWFEFAQKIYDLAGADSELVQPIESNQLHQMAKRPSRSILNTTKWVDSQLGNIPSWEISLASLMPEIICTINLERQP